MLAAMLLEEVLQCEFSNTAYATNTYLAAGRKAQLLRNGVLSALSRQLARLLLAAGWLHNRCCVTRILAPPSCAGALRIQLVSRSAATASQEEAEEEVEQAQQGRQPKRKKGHAVQ